jgi:hypothetical protein
MMDDIWGYAGYKKCGCMVAVVIDETDSGTMDGRERTARAVADMIREGLVVKRVRQYEVQRDFTICTCEEPAEQPYLLYPKGSLIDSDEVFYKDYDNTYTEQNDESL